MSETIENPFTDWKPEQQCFGTLARDKYGFPVKYTSPQAVTWCAYGWMGHKGIRSELKITFDDFVGCIVDKNDGHRLSPSWFKEKWDLFQKELKS